MLLAWKWKYDKFSKSWQWSTVYCLRDSVISCLWLTKFNLHDNYLAVLLYPFLPTQSHLTLHVNALVSKLHSMCLSFSHLHAKSCSEDITANGYACNMSLWLSVRLRKTLSIQRSEATETGTEQRVLLVFNTSWQRSFIPIITCWSSCPPIYTRFIWEPQDYGFVCVICVIKKVK